MNGKLVRIEKTKASGTLRNGEIEGVFAYLPTVGKDFEIVGKSLAFTGGGRLVETSKVTAIIQPETSETDLINGKSRRIRFTTENSLYELYIWEEPNVVSN